MLRTRLWMGTVLVVLVAGMLVIDLHLGPWYPFLFVFVLGLALASCLELLYLLPPDRRPLRGLCFALIAALVIVNWLPHLPDVTGPLAREAWRWLGAAFGLAVLFVFAAEMAAFSEPGGSVIRMAVTIWAVAYLALLPSFFAQLRWLNPSKPDQGTAALMLAIFVPKCCDIGAYVMGRLFGRHPMTPVLSPKKTWEGAIGGLALAVGVAVAIDRLGPAPILRMEWLREVGFGLTVGVAGMIGDLAESLVKRDCRHKDASQAVPGFGGVLDVVDSVVYAAPIAYLWLG